MLKFRPILKNLVWGGEKIASFKGISTEQNNIGESWEISTLPGDESIVAEGTWAGRTLTEVIRHEQAALLGQANYACYGDRFPLLVKFIDAKHDLSVQVHPNDRLAQIRHGKGGKAEMWYVVAADADASLRLGFEHPVTPEAYEAAVADGSILDLMKEYRVASGDLFYLPPGRIHTIGAGCFLVEVQQPSDVTYRIYDYNRLGLDGKPRELHTAWAREAIDYTCLSDSRINYPSMQDRGVELVHSEHFTVHLFDLTQDYIFDLAMLDSFVVLICVEGEGSLLDERGERMAIRRGETLLVPASTQRLTAELCSKRFKCLACYL